jgi:hypothetical protein
MVNAHLDTPTEKHSTLSLLDLLDQFRYCRAKDPRDKIYALLGLATDIEPTDCLDGVP